MRLSDEGKKAAATIYKTLQYVSSQFQKKKLGDVIHEAKTLLKAGHIEVEYLETANASTLKPTDHWQAPGDNIVLLAAYIENVRLIDNLQF